jgi:hypothetical protein
MRRDPITKVTLEEKGESGLYLRIKDFDTYAEAYAFAKRITIDKPTTYRFTTVSTKVDLIELHPLSPEEQLIKGRNEAAHARWEKLYTMSDEELKKLQDNDILI